MINDAISGGGLHPQVKVIVNDNAGTEEAKRKETLENQAKALSEFIEQDTVEISDEARALSEAARTLSEKEAALEEQPTTVVIEAPKSEEAAATNNSTGAKVTTAAASAVEERKETVKNYNEILNDLRSQYDEVEALRRFNEIMEADGYEVVTDFNGTSGVRETFGTSTSTRYTGNRWLATLDNDPIRGIWTADNKNDSNLRTHSYIYADEINGQTNYLAGTYSNYSAAVNDEVKEALNALYYENLKTAQGKIDGIDLEEYANKVFGSGSSPNSIVSASRDLGSITQDLLKKTGVTLSEGQNVSFELFQDENGEFTGLHVSGDVDMEKVQKEVDRIIAKDPSILQAFVDEYNSVDFIDVSSLDGQFDNGVQSLKYSNGGRKFVISGDDLSVTVMTEGVNVMASGYVYQKKESDAFDPYADSTSVVAGFAGFDGDETDYQKVREDLENAITSAVESGEQIQSTVTEDEWNKATAGKSSAARQEAMRAQVDMNYTPPATHEAGARTDNPEVSNKAEKVKEESVFDKIEVSFVDEKENIRKIAFSQIAKSIDPQKWMQPNAFINNIMEYLSKNIN